MEELLFSQFTTSPVDEATITTTSIHSGGQYKLEVKVRDYLFVVASAEKSKSY